jgi:hypothetical protein
MILIYHLNHLIPERCIGSFEAVSRDFSLDVAGHHIPWLSGVHCEKIAPDLKPAMVWQHIERVGVLSVHAAGGGLKQSAMSWSSFPLHSLYMCNMSD